MALILPKKRGRKKKKNSKVTQEEANDCMTTVLKYLKQKKEFSKADVIRQVYSSDDKDFPKQIKKFIDNRPTQLSPEDCTALILKKSISKDVYQQVKNVSDLTNNTFLVPYNDTLEVKKRCLPKDIEGMTADSIFITQYPFHSDSKLF